MLSEFELMVKQEQLKDRMRRREIDRVLAADGQSQRRKQPHSRRQEAATAVRALKAILLAR